MSTHLLSTLRAVPGKKATLIASVESGLKPLMEKQGWKLLGFYAGLSGPINTMVALWEMDSPDHYLAGRASAAGDPDFPAVRAALDECLADETLLLLDRKF